MKVSDGSLSINIRVEKMITVEKVIVKIYYLPK